MCVKQYISDVIQFTGSHYDFGYRQGELLKKSPLLYNRDKQWKNKRKYHFTIDPTEATQLFTKYMPKMLDELHGLADALNWPFHDALREFGGYYVEYARSGCSILTGSEFMIRNYDSDPAFYEGRYMIYRPTDGGYATIGPSMQVTGRMDGMNEKGLVMGYNFINRRDTENGFLCNMIGRMVLETCANADEAIALLKELPHRVSFNYALIDPSGEGYVVEASPREVIARKSTISTNHFDVLVEENRYRTEDSMRRMEKLRMGEQQTKTIYAAYQLLNNTEHEVFAHKYGASAGTIHTSAYLPRERKALFAIGSNQPPVIFDFNRFLAGERIPITQIKGKLSYHLPFATMEKMK